MARLKTGNAVLCRFFNIPEGRFYGDTWVGTIKEIDCSRDKPYLVVNESGYETWMYKKEIKRYKGLGQ